MKRIVPGRGPSKMGAAGSVFVTIFGIFWTIMAFSMTRDSPFPMVGVIFPLFGVIFVGMGIFQTVYHFKNAVGKNRMPLFDIEDSEDERRLPRNHRNHHGQPFCPYCGKKLELDYQFCPQCGKES
ncbi:zinc ribbon domain-containing protein [Paenibacillus sp. GCM10027628]|uniref:zinc ribbon domain-containing protein n=1 Tax=Paenibacillus sp. GCM10027628 TaxID=3273413 RepID=UPI003626BF3B